MFRAIFARQYARRVRGTRQRPQECACQKRPRTSMRREAVNGELRAALQVADGIKRQITEAFEGSIPEGDEIL